MYLTDDEIDEIAVSWDLYSPQPDGCIDRYDFRRAVDEATDKVLKKLEDNQ